MRLLPSTAGRVAAGLLRAVPIALVAACASSDGVVTPKQPTALRQDVGVASTSGVVISQIYGAGGNSGAPLRNDYVELYNAGSATVSLVGFSIQYASAAGTGNFGANSSQLATLSGSIAPGKYYLVQLASGGSAGTVLPTADATGDINLSGTAGKVALVDQTASLGCNGGSAPCNATALSHIIDLVGYGTTANFVEGTAPATAPSTANAIFRKDNGAQDTNDNKNDFQTGAPSPRNSGSSGPPTVGPLDHVTVTGNASVAVNGTTVLTATLQDANNQTITDATATYNWISADPTTVQVVSTAGATATVKGIKIGGPVTINVSATSNSITKSGSKDVSVTPPASNVSVSSRTVPLPVGFQTQLFVSGTDFSGNPASGNVTWSTSNPAVLTVDQTGVITATGVGSAQIIATTPDGASGATTVSTESQLFSSTARSGHNTEFGTPTDANASNDVIIARKQYTLSYNPQRGGPNWVSWDLSTTHLGSADRCNCFTADTALTRLGYPAYTTNDYITGGLFDRGHMEPSADQTTTDTENGATFILTNVLPQKHDLNAGPWEKLEIALRDSARAGREVYIIAGGIYTNGTGLGSLNGLGKIFIPDSTWKIVVLVPAGTGLADVKSASDVNVIAVNMPNVDGIITNAWEPYRTTVNKIQQSTGYDFLSALPDGIESVVEGQTPGVRALDIDIQPSQISLSTTTTVNVVLLSTSTFNATSVNAADVRLVVNGGPQVAPITRGTTVNTSVGDFNGDGRPDRLIGFSTASLKAAGLTTSASSLVLQPAGSSPAWQGYDVTPPVVKP